MSLVEGQANELVADHFIREAQGPIDFGQRIGCQELQHDVEALTDLVDLVGEALHAPLVELLERSARFVRHLLQPIDERLDRRLVGVGRENDHQFIGPHDLGCTSLWTRRCGRGP